MWTFFCTIPGLILIVVMLYFQFCERNRKLNKIPGPKGWPFLGNAFDIMVSRERLLKLTSEWKNKYGDIMRLWSMHIRVVLVFQPAYVEKILSSTKFNEKRTPYNFLRPWLCEGLLVSNGEKWHQRRKMLTPAFHFDILKQFMTTFVDESNLLVAELQQEVGKGQTDPLTFLTISTLNVMCDTAMGTQEVKGKKEKINEYLRGIQTMGECVLFRLLRVWYHVDWPYIFSPHKRIRDRVVTKLHKFSEDLIQERRVYRQKVGFNSVQAASNTEYGKKRMAMLDLLLENENRGQIDRKGVREEVDTFMFEGHDTTALAISFCMLSIANEEDVQERICEELQQIFGDDDRDPSVQDLNDMRYLECCIKESLRLYPSVPRIMRHLKAELDLGDYVVPSNTMCHIDIFEIHRRADFFPEPERFIPERFWSANVKNHSRYAYIPFSAGPRNCIGQKFAMMEMKTMLSRILRKFRLEPVTRIEDLTFTADLLLRTKDPFYIRIANRF